MLRPPGPAEFIEKVGVLDVHRDPSAASLAHSPCETDMVWVHVGHHQPAHVAPRVAGGEQTPFQRLPRGLRLHPAVHQDAALGRLYEPGIKRVHLERQRNPQAVDMWGPRNQLCDFLISDRNSSRVCFCSRNSPSIALVTVPECCFSTPRIIMQKCCASHTTPTPLGVRCCCRQTAISCVSRS